jgi:hypothetical protein
MITSIISAINTAIESVSPDENIQVFGLAKLMLKGTQVHPVADANNAQITVNDSYDGVLYHRIISTGSSEESEEFSFGATPSRETTVRIRTVLCNKKALTEDFKYEVANRIPDTITLSGYKYIDVGESMTIIEDDDAIYEQEFGGGDYEKRREPWIISALEYDIKFLLC